jgi:hypothetical protein
MEKYRAAFAEEGLDLPVKVQKFLSLFGGLVIPYVSRENQEDTLDFCADEAVQGLGCKALRPYETIVDSGKLSPIGYFAGGTCLLMMAASAKVYGGVNWRVLYVGETGVHAIENIISGKNIKVVYDKSPSKAVEQ